VLARLVPEALDETCPVGGSNPQHRAPPVLGRVTDGHRVSGAADLYALPAVPAAVGGLAPGTDFDAASALPAAVGGLTPRENDGKMPQASLALALPPPSAAPTAGTPCAARTATGTVPAPKPRNQRRPPALGPRKTGSLLPAPEEPANVVTPVTGPRVHIGRIGLGPGSERLDQSGGLRCQAAEPPCRMPQAQARQPQQRTPGPGPLAYRQAAALDELTVVIIQRGTDERVRRCGIPRPIADSPLHCRPGDIMRQRGRIPERPMNVHPAKLPRDRASDRGRPGHTIISI
jgi:hypothetical protein